MAKDRTIVYVQKVINDPGNAKAAQEQIRHFKELESAALKAGQAMQAVYGGNRARNSSTPVAARITGGATSGGGGGTTSGGRGAVDRTFRDEFTAWKRATDERVRGEQHAATATSRAWRESRSAVVAATDAAMQYARAIAYTVAADEETVLALSKVIVRFEAFAAVANGTARALEGVRKAQSAISTMHAAGGSFGAGGGGLIGKASNLIGGLGPNGALGFAALSAAVLAGVAVLVESLNQGQQRVKDAASKFRGQLNANPNTSVDLQFLERESRFGNKTASAQLSEAHSFLGQYDAQQDAFHQRAIGGWRVALENRSGMPGDAKQRLADAHDYASAAAGFQSEFEDKHRQAQGSTGLGASGDQQRALEGIHEAIRARLEGVRRVGEAEIEIKRTQADAARENLANLKARRDALMSELQAAKEARMSATERFGAAPEKEQQLILAAARKAQAGGALNRDEENLLEGYNPEGVAASRRNRAVGVPGFTENIDRPYLAPRENAAQTNVTNINNKIDVANNFVVQLDKEISKAVEDVRVKLKSVGEQLTAITSQLSDVRTGNQIQESQRILQRNTSGL